MVLPFQQVILFFLKSFQMKNYEMIMCKNKTNRNVSAET